MTNIEIHPDAGAVRGLSSVPPDRRVLLRLRVPLLVSQWAPVSQVALSAFGRPLRQAHPGDLLIADAREFAACAPSGRVLVHRVTPNLPRASGWALLSDVSVVPADDPVAL